MKLLIKSGAVFDRAVDILAVLAGALIALIVIAVTFSVVTRFFFGISWVGLVELSAMSLLFITFLGTTWILRRGGHTTMDILVKRLNPRAQAIVNTVTSLLCALACLVLVWYGTQVFWTRFIKGTYLFSHVDIPDAYFLFIIPVGSFFLFIQFLRRANGYIRGYRETRNSGSNGIV